MTEYKALKRWSMPSDYAGEIWPNYYVGVGIHRDSSRVARSNFDVFLRELGGESETVHVVREGHWAVGWVEWIAIHQDDERACEIADELICALDDYPVLDDSHLSELEDQEIGEQWAAMRLHDRVDVCRDAGVSIFAARRDEVPGEVFDELRYE